MKVKDLKKILEDWGDDTEVWLSSDEEGNAYNKLTLVFPGVPDTYKSWTDTMYQPGDEDFDEKNQVLVLCP